MIAKGTSMTASIASAAIVLGLCASMAAAISCDKPDISGVWGASRSLSLPPSLPSLHGNSWATCGNPTRIRPVF